MTSILQGRGNDEEFLPEGVFRVWPMVHPGTTIVPTNMNPGVEFMVRRGLAERR